MTYVVSPDSTDQMINQMQQEIVALQRYLQFYLNVSGDLSGQLPSPEVLTVLGGGTPLVAANNLNDVSNKTSAVTNLGAVDTYAGPGTTQQQSRISRVTASAAFVPTVANTFQLSTLNTVDVDPDIGFNTSTHLFTVPVTGRYEIGGTVGITNNTGVAVNAQVASWIGGAANTQYIFVPLAIGGAMTVNFHDNIPLTASQTIGLACAATSIAGTGVSFFGITFTIRLST